MSAPVSRGDDGGGSYAREGTPDRPGRITLSIQQKDMARTLGLSDKEYAEKLLDMREIDKDTGSLWPSYSTAI